ncbi:MAG: nuclear transport factor 2 family protein [Candidatus Sulfotelmatobacter sp.]|jgi:ketosteroid isomerase-like protein
MKSAGLVTILLCSAAWLTAAQSGADVDAVTKVLALEHAWNQAEEQKDTKAMDAIFDNAIVVVDYDGSLRTKAEFLARMRSENSHPQIEVTESMTAHMLGTTVVVTGVYMMKGVENGKAYARRGRFIDTWAFKNGNWLCVTSQATPILH